MAGTAQWAGFCNARQRQAGLYRPPAADLRLDLADSDRLGAQQARWQRHLVSRISSPMPSKVAARAAAAREASAGGAKRPATPTQPTSSWRSARGRSRASASSGRTSRSSPIRYLGMGLFPGATPQGVWPYLSTFYPDQALAYQGTAFLASASFNLGDSATIGNLSFEIIGILEGTGANGIDADPALVIYDFLTNAQYGAGFNPASIDATTLFGAGGDASLQTYCRAQGIAFSPVLSSQEQASSILTRWLQLLNCAAVWSGGELRFIPYGDSAIAAGAQTVFNAQFSIPRPVALSTGYAVRPIVEVCSAVELRLRRRRGLRILEYPVRLCRRQHPDHRRDLRHVAERDVSLRAGRRRQGDRHHLHLPRPRPLSRPTSRRSTP